MNRATKILIILALCGIITAGACNGTAFSSMHTGFLCSSQNDEDPAQKTNSHEVQKMAEFIKMEDGVFKVPLILTPDLEPRRDFFESEYLGAQRMVRAFAKKHGWEALTDEPFMDKVEIYGNKPDFDERMIELTGADPATSLPATYSAGLEGRVLIAISPEIYWENYADGREEGAHEKLLAHEIFHRLHVRILKGDEDAMGPIWFFEGFAIYACGQFAHNAPELSEEEIWKIVNSKERGSYKKYATVIRHFLKKRTIEELVGQAGKPDFIKWLKNKE